MELWHERVRLADSVPVPRDVLELPVLTTQATPIEEKVTNFENKHVIDSTPL